MQEYTNHTHTIRYSAGVVSVYFGTSPVRLSAVSGETLVRREGWITNPQTEVLYRVNLDLNMQ